MVRPILPAPSNNMCRILISEKAWLIVYILLLSFLLVFFLYFIGKFKQFDRFLHKMIIDGKDKDLLELLRNNARSSTTFLAKKLGMSRTTVNSRIERLEKRGIIKGYTIKFDDNYERGQLQAHVMIHSQPKASAHIIHELKRISAVTALHAVNGNYEMVAMIEAASTEALDEVLDTIGNVEGINKTTTSIILSTKFMR